MSESRCCDTRILDVRRKETLILLQFMFRNVHVVRHEQDSQFTVFAWLALGLARALQIRPEFCRFLTCRNPKSTRKTGKAVMPWQSVTHYPFWASIGLRCTVKVGMPSIFITSDQLLARVCSSEYHPLAMQAAQNRGSLCRWHACIGSYCRQQF
jgi:hypothetical protein